MKKKVILISFLVAVVIAVLIGLIIWLVLKNTKNTTQKPTPYVEENNIPVLSIDEKIEVPVKPYAKDTNKNIITPEGVTFEDTKASYKFYDYKESEEDEEGYVIYSIKYDIEVPVKFTVDTSKTNPQWGRTIGLPLFSFFDYYTGEIYKEKNVSLDNKLKYLSADNLDDNMKFINVSWDGKEYKVGVRTESVSKWDGVKEISDTNGIKTYVDTQRSTLNVYLYAPKDYDGLMLFIHKAGSSKERVLKVQEYSKTITNNQDEAVYKLLEPRYGEDRTYNNDEFYVVRLSDFKQK